MGKVAESEIIALIPLAKSLAANFARRYQGAGTDSLDDLVSAAFEGLCQSALRYEPQHNTSFKTYAACRMTGAIQDCLRGEDLIPRSIRRAMRQIKEILETAPNTTNEELFVQLGITHETFDQAIELYKAGGLKFLSLDQEEGEDELNLHSAIPAPVPEESPEEFELLEPMLQRLNVRNRIALLLYYVNDVTMNAIGPAIGTTESRVSQLIQRILGFLKGRGKQYGDHPRFVELDQFDLSDWPPEVLGELKDALTHPVIWPHLSAAHIAHAPISLLKERGVSLQTLEWAQQLQEKGKTMTNYPSIHVRNALDSAGIAGIEGLAGITLEQFARIPLHGKSRRQVRRLMLDKGINFSDGRPGDPLPCAAARPGSSANYTRPSLPVRCAPPRPMVRPNDPEPAEQDFISSLIHAARQHGMRMQIFDPSYDVEISIRPKAA